MGKGFSKSAPKLWCFSGHVWKFQNHSGAVMNPRFSDSEEFWDFLLCRLFVLMGNLLFPRWLWREPKLMCENINTLKNNTGFGAESAEQQFWLDCSQIGIITNWTHRVGRERKTLSYNCSKRRKDFERIRTSSHITSSMHLRCHILCF